MAGLIDRARKRVKETVENLRPMKRLSEGLGGGPDNKPKVKPAKKRKKIKPQGNKKPDVIFKRKDGRYYRHSQ